jgi:hypothetical protein
VKPSYRECEKADDWPGTDLGLMGSAGAVDFLQQFGTRLVMVVFDRIAGSFSKRQRTQQEKRRSWPWNIGAQFYMQPGFKPKSEGPHVGGIHDYIAQQPHDIVDGKGNDNYCRHTVNRPQ